MGDKMPSFNISTDKILQGVHEDGLYKIPNFLDQDEIDTLKEEMSQAFSIMSTGDELCYPNETSKCYPFGKICRVGRDDMGHFPNMRSLFSDNWFSELTDKYFQCPNEKMLQVFFSHEYVASSSADGVTRNSVLHFDPYEAFKFMIYINDCDQNNGAFRYIKGSHVDGKNTRQQYPLGELLQDKYRLDQNPQLSSKYSEDNVTYASATAGSLLVFTTDVLHGGGIIQEQGLERMGIICHNRRA